MSFMTNTVTRNRFADTATKLSPPMRRSLQNRQTRYIWLWHREKDGWPSHSDAEFRQKALQAQKLFLFKCLTTWGRSPFWNRIYRDPRSHCQNLPSFARHSPWNQGTRLDHERPFASRPSEGRRIDEAFRHLRKPNSEQQSRTDAFEEFKKRIDADPWGALFGRRLDRLVHGRESGIWSSLTRSLESMEASSAASSDTQAKKSSGQTLKHDGCEKYSTQDDAQVAGKTVDELPSVDNTAHVKYEYDPISMRNVPRVEQVSKPKIQSRNQPYPKTESGIDITVKKFRGGSTPNDVRPKSPNGIRSGRDEAAGLTATKSVERPTSEQSAATRPNSGCDSSLPPCSEIKSHKGTTKSIKATPRNPNTEAEPPLFSGTTYEQKAKSIMARCGQDTPGWLSREGFSTSNPEHSSSKLSSQSKPVISGPISTTNKIEPALDRFHTSKSNLQSHSPSTNNSTAANVKSMILSEHDAERSDDSGATDMPPRVDAVSGDSSHRRSQAPISYKCAGQEQAGKSSTLLANDADQQVNQETVNKAVLPDLSGSTREPKHISSKIATMSHSRALGSKGKSAPSGALPANKGAAAPVEDFQSRSNGNDSGLHGPRTKFVKDSKSSQDSELAQKVAQKEKLHAEALEEQARAQARTNALWKAAEQTKAEAEKNERSLRALVPDIKALYEARYGKVTAGHRQEPHVEASEARPEKTGGMAVSEVDLAARTNDPLATLKSHEHGDWWQTRKIKKQDAPISVHQSDPSVGAGAAAQQQQYDYVQYQHTEPRSIPYSKDIQHHQKEAHEQKPTSRASYKVLAYDKSTRRITIADTVSSFIRIKEEPLHPTEVLARLNRTAKFLPYLEDLQNDGYEIVSGHGDILIFKRTKTAPATRVEDASSMVEEQAQKQSPNAKIRRQEPVFSGSGQTWQEESSRRPSGPGRLKRVTRDVLLTGTITAGVFYAIGAVAEAMQDDGIEYKGKGRPGIYSTQDSR